MQYDETVKVKFSQTNTPEIEKITFVRHFKEISLKCLSFEMNERSNYFFLFLTADERNLCYMFDMSMCGLSPKGINRFRLFDS